jgi:bifunctional DNA-binding transcriptional regulator/antitoxin component of YhaV-PrlF toxin-antitoxin module
MNQGDVMELRKNKGLSIGDVLEKMTRHERFELVDLAMKRVSGIATSSGFCEKVKRRWKNMDADKLEYPLVWLSNASHIARVIEEERQIMDAFGIQASKINQKPR